MIFRGLLKGTIGLCISLSFALQAENTELQLQKFDLKPFACVTQYRGQKCVMTAKLEWQTNQVAEMCFYQGDSQLKCWANANQGSFTTPLALEQTTEFHLRLKNSETPLASKKIKINFVNKYRRRLRPQWSLF